MNKKQIINEALAEIEKQKYDAEMKAKQNYDFAREKSKAFKKIDLTLRQKTFETGKNYTKESQKELNTIKQKWIDELKKLNLTESNLKPNYSCKICEDTGYINGNKCVCLKKKLQKYLIKNSGLSSAIVHNFSLSSEEILKQNPTLLKAHTLGKTYAEKFPNIKTKNLVFMGEVGTGKTFLLECIASELLKKEFYVVYVTAFNLSNTMLKALTVSPFESETIMSPLLECDLLIIDDLGTEPMMRNVSVSNLFTILNEREINNKPTLISTNLSFDAIEDRYGNRLFSRMFNKRTTKVIKFVGSDLRIKTGR